MTDAPKFTRETLVGMVAYAHRCGYNSQPQGDLAAYALALRDRAERAERERDEAEEAILDIRSRVLAVKTGEPREELWNLLKYAERWQSCVPPSAVRLSGSGRGDGSWCWWISE